MDAAKFLAVAIVSWLVAGLQGIINATIAFDVIVHNTMWIVGHFHNMALLNIGLVIFASVYAFLPRLTGREWYSESLANVHLWLTVIGGYGMVLPMLVQGLEGAPPRYAVLPTAYDALTQLTIPFVIMTALGQAVFAFNLIQTLRGKVHHGRETVLRSLGFTRPGGRPAGRDGARPQPRERRREAGAAGAGRRRRQVGDRRARALRLDVRQLPCVEGRRHDRARGARPGQPRARQRARPHRDRAGRRGQRHDAAGAPAGRRGRAGRRLRREGGRKVGIAAPPSKRLPLAAAALSVGAGLTHASVTVPHVREYWLFGLLFAIVAPSQVVWAALVQRRPADRRLLIAGALGNVAVAAVWLVSRTTGLPIGPHAGTPEAVGVKDVLATADELGLALVVAVAWRCFGWTRPGSARSRGHSPASACSARCCPATERHAQATKAPARRPLGNCAEGHRQCRHQIKEVQPRGLRPHRS
jgi:hypothetical protein